MERKLSDIDFSYLHGQKVEEVNNEKNAPFGLVFSEGALTIECPWRIQYTNEVKIGYSDILHSKGTYQDVKKVLLGKRIVQIIHYEQISDLIVEFEDGIYLEVFHDSTYFEGWQLAADNGLYLVSLPGGDYSVFE